MHRSGITFGYACVCGHVLMLHLCNYVEDTVMHTYAYLIGTFIHL